MSLRSVDWRRWFERSLVMLVAVSFAVPLMLAGSLGMTHDHAEWTAWLRNSTLVGTPYAFTPVKATWPKLLSTKIQTAVADNYNHGFVGRELMIRCINELYWRALQRFSKRSHREGWHALR